MKYVYMINIMNKKFIQSIFSSVSSKYDIMNDLMSFGMHKCWKKCLVDNIDRSQHSLSILDVAGGTGDVSIEILKRSPFANITSLDLNIDMLSAGKRKLIDRNFLGVNWVCGDAQNIPISDEKYDYYITSFGMRNFTNKAKALSEAYRVLKPGGKFLCLEFTPKASFSLLNKAYELYSFILIPKIGKYITGNEDAYNYLVESIRSFPTQKEFLEMITDNGLINCSYENHTGGIVAIHSAIKPVNF